MQDRRYAQASKAHAGRLAERVADLRKHAAQILDAAIKAALPDVAVARRLLSLEVDGPVTLVAIGKAAWRMARAAREVLSGRVRRGIVITKYGHSEGPLGALIVREAGHPLPDANGVAATVEALRLLDDADEAETVLFLISGGGSALFEDPAPGVTLEELSAISDRLIRSGADIVEINTVRKRLSQVKGGRFAERAAPRRILSLVLSDVLGDRLDSIASGPAHPDATTSAEALEVAERYRLTLSEPARAAVGRETPKRLDNVESHVIGSVRTLCEEAARAAEGLGYRSLLISTSLDCEARGAGAFVAAMAREIRESGRPLAPPCALVLGGETVVTVRGAGRGGRSQELALAAAVGIAGLDGIVVAAASSDGTDGPTDAAGGIVDGATAARISGNALDARRCLADNDAYRALLAAGDLFKTGPTGTNVNDLAVLLVGS
jgi:glycerate 2-kinase